MASAQSIEDLMLQSFFKGWLEKSFHQQPLLATTLGEHRFDGELDDISPAARQGWEDHARRTLKQLPQTVNYARLSRDGQVDYEIFENALKYQIWQAEHLRLFEQDPRVYGNYLNDSVYLLLAQSTLPRESNLANALARMEQMPRIIAEARRSLTAPCRPILETAIRQNQGAIHFYESDIFHYAGDTQRREKLQAAAARVVAELQAYQRFLETDARARARDDWRLGREKFEERFAFETGVGLTAGENLAEARAEFARVQSELNRVSRQLWPEYFPGTALPPDDAAGQREVVTRVIEAVNREHGGADALVADARATVASIQTFIRQRNYLQLPEPDRCDVIEMPEFRRGNSLAYLEVAPPLDPRAASFYAVSPPPADWTPRQVQSFLEEYNRHMLKILTIHEAYPGHYVQFAHANGIPSLIRKLLPSGSYVEGWAVFGEGLMLDEGFGRGDLRLRLMQLKFYLRAVANSILDYEMHCTPMTDEAAMKFLTVEAYQSEGEARLKVIRAKQSSVQLSTYFVGRMAFFRLHQTMARELNGRFELARYHDAVLNCGAVPPKYLAELVRGRLLETL